MRGLEAIKFWTLRNAFWVSTTIALLGILYDFASRHFQYVGVSTPIATLLGFYLASLTLLHNQVSTSVTEYNRLNEQFGNIHMEKLRTLVASNYLQEGSDDWEDLFDFFEEITFKTRLGIIEMQAAYQMFSYWILNYWFLCEQRLKKRRRVAEEDKDLYSEMEWLVERFISINFRVRGEIFLRRAQAIERYRGEAQESRTRFLKEELGEALGGAKPESTNED